MFPYYLGFRANCIHSLRYERINKFDHGEGTICSSIGFILICWLYLLRLIFEVNWDSGKWGFGYKKNLTKFLFDHTEQKLWPRLERISTETNKKNWQRPIFFLIWPKTNSTEKQFFLTRTKYWPRPKNFQARP